MPKIKMPAITRVVATGLRMKISGMLIDCRSEEHTSELQSQSNLVCRLLLEKKNKDPQHPLLTLPAAHPLVFPLLNRIAQSLSLLVLLHRPPDASDTQYHVSSAP